MIRLDGRKVLQVLPALDEGGVEQSAIDMARHIVRIGGTALVTSAGGKRVGEISGPRMRHVALPLADKTPWTMLSNARRIERLIRAEQPDIVHVRSRAPAWSAWLACRRTGMTDRYVATFHGTYGAGNALKRRYNSVMLRGRLVIANSAFIAAHIRSVYGIPAERIVVAPRGVDARFLEFETTPEDQAALRRTMGIAEATPLLLMVGRLTRWKGQDVLLKALASVRDLPWIVAFAGGATSPDYAAEIERLAGSLGIADRVRWLGRRDDVPHLNAASALAFSCSVEPEAFGRVAVEAMALGVPVIASRLGGSTETIIDGATGWLVPPGDARALADAIRAALSDPQQLLNMRKRARTHVRANYTVDHCCESEAAAYGRLLGAVDQALG